MPGVPKGKLKLGGCLVTVPGSRDQTPASPYFSAVLNFMTPGPSSLLCGPLLASFPCTSPLLSAAQPPRLSPVRATQKLLAQAPPACAE